jgi:Flp pilus assembly pilin Flp
VLKVPLIGFGFPMADDPVEEEAMRWIMRLLRDDGGAIEMEYGLFAALFAVGAVAVLQLVGVLERF